MIHNLLKLQDSLIRDNLSRTCDKEKRNPIESI